MGYESATKIEQITECLIAHSDINTKGHSQNTFSMKIKTPQGTDSDGDGNTWFVLQVYSTSADKLPSDLVTFVQNHAPALFRTLQQMEDTFVGPFLSFQLPLSSDACVIHDLRWCQTSSSFVQKSSIKPKPTDRATVQLKVHKERSFMADQCSKIKTYLHKLKLLNSKMNITFCNYTSGQLEKEVFSFSGHSSHFSYRHIATDIEHYVAGGELTEGQDKVLPKSGTFHLLKEVRLNKTHVGLRVSCIAFLAPPKSIFINSYLTCAKVVFYGPKLFPLVLPGSSIGGVMPGVVVNIKQYGLSFGETKQQPGNGTVLADWCYELHSEEEKTGSQKEASQVEEEGSGNGQEKQEENILYIVVMLKPNKEQADDAYSTFNLLRGIRQNLAQILCRNRTKIRKAVGSALDKIICNFSSVDQKEQAVRTAIPGIVQAITEVVKHSTDDTFREACWSSLKVSTTMDFRDSLQSSLWSLAKLNLGVEKLQTRCVMRRKPSENEAPAHTSVNSAEVPDKRTTVHAVVNSQVFSQLLRNDDERTEVQEGKECQDNTQGTVDCFDSLAFSTPTIPFTSPPISGRDCVNSTFRATLPTYHTPASTAMMSEEALPECANFVSPIHQIAGSTLSAEDESWLDEFPM